MIAPADEDVWDEPGNREDFDYQFFSSDDDSDSDSYDSYDNINSHLDEDNFKPLQWDDKNVLTKINYKPSETNVRPTEVKTYGCLSHILDDLHILLNVWKKRKRLPVCVSYEAARAEIGGNIKTKIETFMLRRSPLNDQHKRSYMYEPACPRVILRRLLNSWEQFQRIFRGEQGFKKLISEICDMEGRILRLLVPRLNNLLSDDQHCLPLAVWEKIWPLVLRANRKLKTELKITVQDVEEAVLEGDLITDAFGATANLYKAMWQALFSLGYNDKEIDDQEFACKISDFRQKNSLLIGFLERVWPEAKQGLNETLSSLIGKGSYTVKQLCLMPNAQARLGNRMSCGQSISKLLILEDKVINMQTRVHLYNVVKRKVVAKVAMVSLPDNGFSDGKSFLFGEEFLAVSTTIHNLLRFSFTVMRWKIDPEGDYKSLGTNDCSCGVIIREVAAKEGCRDLTFHMLNSPDDEESLIWLVIFRDGDSTSVVFFDSTSGAEIGRERMRRVALKALRDDKAIFVGNFEDKEDNKECRVYKIVGAGLDLVAKISLLPKPEPEGEPYFYCKHTKCFFDESSSSRFVLITPQGEHQLYDVTTPTLAVAPPLQHVFLPKHEAKAYCLVDSVLFVLIEDKSRSAFFLKAMDLLSNPTESTYCLCGFQSRGINSHDPLPNVPIGMDDSQHFIPYTRPRKFGDGYFCRGKDQNCLSYMWRLKNGGDFQLRYGHRTETLFVMNSNDANLLEVKFLRENAVPIRAKLAAKQREVQDKWENEESRTKDIGSTLKRVFKLCYAL